jgi:hypothetical protein
MINIKDYYLNNSIKLARQLIVPKRYLAAFVSLYNGEKAASIFKNVKDVFGTNAGYRESYDLFIDETFELAPLKKIVSIKKPEYQNMTLSSGYPFTDSLRNGLRIIKDILGFEDLNEISDDLLFRLMDIRLPMVKEVCFRNQTINCGIDQNIFDFVIARECLLNQTKMSPEEIAKEFYDLLIYGELLDEMIRNVRPENREKCVRTIRSLSIATFDPRFEIYELEQLNSISISELFYYVGSDINILINVLNYFSDESENVIPQLLNNYLSTLDKDDFAILSRREKETLEKIGEDYGVTRERIRQIEAKQIEKFNEFYLNNFSSEKKNLIFVFPKVSSIFPLGYLKDQLGQNYDCFRNLMQSIKFAGEAKYYKNIDSVVESERVYLFFQRMVDEVLGNYFKKTDLNDKINACLESLSGYGFDEVVIKNYISSNYKEKEFTYVKDGFRLSKAFELECVLENYFDDGFHFSDEEHIKKANEYALEEFGEILFDLSEIDMSNPHTVQAIVERAHARMVDRGTYVHYTKAHDLPIELVEKIIAYLKEKNRPLAYSNLFETFKDELNVLGIDNKYALQGAMSIYFGELFKGKRDYVMPIEINQTLRDSMNSWVASRTSIFTYEDFTKEFKGVAQSVFMAVLYEVGNMAYYWMQGYINVSCLNISESDKDKLKQLADYLINQYHMEYCSADELFNLVNIQMHDFITACGMKYSYDLFSVMQILFANDYKFKRPMLGSKDAVFESSNEMVDGYLAQRNTVKLMKMRKYIDTKTGHSPDEYITVFDIIKNKWNEFVAVDADTIVRKETITVTEKELIRLDVIIEMLLEQKNSLNIEEEIVNKFFFKELAGMAVNRYVILGLVNTFLHDKYEVSADGNKYRGGTFFISHKK